MSLKKLRRRYEEQDRRERRALWGGRNWLAWGFADSLIYLLWAGVAGIAWLINLLDWRFAVVVAVPALAFLGFRLIEQYRATRRYEARRLGRQE